MLLVCLHVYRSINPLPHMAILGYANSAANRDMMSKMSVGQNPHRIKPPQDKNLVDKSSLRQTPHRIKAL